MVDNDSIDNEPIEESGSEDIFPDNEPNMPYDIYGNVYGHEYPINGSDISSQNESIVPDLKEVIENNDSVSNSNGKIDLLSRSGTVGSIWNEVSIENIDPFSALSDTYTIEVHGTPDADIVFWDQQDDPNSCAVATTNMMFHSLGLDPGKSLIAEVFEDRGIYDPSFGTNPYFIDEVINIVADHAGINIQATEINGFTETDLTKMLDRGIRLMVGVDAYELYGDDNITLNEIFSIPDAGHAVQVTGVSNKSDGDYVTINDPGFEEGAGQEIPLERFMNAAEDFGFKAIVITAV